MFSIPSSKKEYLAPSVMEVAVFYPATGICVDSPTPGENEEIEYDDWD